jgi:peptidoglycan/LPS O-acetylase OafA/YrhL
MVHELVHTAWIWTAQQFELTMLAADGKQFLAAVLAVTFVSAAGLYHVVEEPARLWMRRMVGDGRPVVDADSAGQVAGYTLQSIDGAHEGRPKSVSARAG